MNSHTHCKGRPYGGIAIMWKNIYNDYVECLETNFHNIQIVKMKTLHGTIILVNAYFPNNNNDNDTKISEYISRLIFIWEVNSEATDIVCGDFNLSPKSMKYRELHDVCKDSNLVKFDVQRLKEDSYTFVSDINHSMTWIDYFIINKNLLSYINYCNIDYHIIIGLLWCVCVHGIS